MSSPARSRGDDAPADGQASDASVDFERDVQPIFAERCFECHGADTREAGLRLDRGADALAGGDSGKVIVPAEPDAGVDIS